MIHQIWDKVAYGDSGRLDFLGMAQDQKILVPLNLGALEDGDGSNVQPELRSKSPRKGSTKKSPKGS